MKKMLLCYLLAVFAVRNHAEPAAKWPQTNQEKREFYYSMPVGPAEYDVIVHVRMVFYSGTRAEDPKNRLFIANGQAFRTVAELKAEILRVGPKAAVYWVLHGNDAMPAPEITADEIADLVTSCRKAKIRFQYEEGG